MKKLATFFYFIVFFTMITCLPASADLYFPHIASIDMWETEVCIINTSSQQNLSGLLQAYGDSGQPVDLKSISLAPKARREMVVGNEFSNSGDIGYMIFSSDSQNAIGYLKFYIVGRYRVAIPAASNVNTGDIYISHIASDNDWTTGVSILNTTSSSKDLSIEFDDGTTKTRTIAANEHQAFTIRELFSDVMQPNIKSAVIKNGTGIMGLEIFGSTEASGKSYLSGILLKDDTTTNIYYPHIASNSTWDTGIVAYNPSDTPCNLTITPYRLDGTPLSPQTRMLAGQEKYIGIIQDLTLPDGTAWFSILASCNITGFELFSTKDGKQLGGYTGVGISSTEGVFAKIDKAGTGIAFVNIEDAPVNVTVTAYDDNGKAIASETFGLNAYEKVVELAPDLFSQDISTANYITYASSGEVVGFQLNVSSDGMMLDALPGLFANDTNGTGGIPNISGVWEFVFTNINSSCGPESGWSSTVTIVQNGSSLETTGFKNTSFIVTGSIENNTVTIGPANFPESGGTTRSTFTLTLTSETSMSGKESWTWSSSGDSCSNGTGDITATKN